MLDHRVQNRQELSHASDQSDLWGFTCGAQSFVKGTNHCIVSAGNQSGHVKHGANASSAAPNGATSSHGTAVAIKRGNAHQGSNLFAIELTEFWELSEEGSADNRERF